MGTLTQQIAPAVAAASSLQWGLASMGATAASDVAAGIGESQQYNYQAQVARNNAFITRTNATSDLAAAGYTESAAKTEAGKLLATQTVGKAASGVDVGVGSPVAVREASARTSAMDAALIHYNATRAAIGSAQTAADYETQAKLDETAAKNSKTLGYTKASASLIGGAASLANRWAQFQQSGAL